MNEEAVPKNTKMATKFGVTVFNGKLFNRFTGENIRLINSIINYANRSKACYFLLTSKKILIVSNGYLLKKPLSIITLEIL